jgi:hypothetical protein
MTPLQQILSKKDPNHIERKIVVLRD